MRRRDRGEVSKGDDDEDVNKEEAEEEDEQEDLKDER